MEYISFSTHTALVCVSADSIRTHSEHALSWDSVLGFKDQGVTWVGLGGWIAVFRVRFFVSRPWWRSGCVHGWSSTKPAESQFRRIPMGRHTPHNIRGSVVLKEPCKSRDAWVKTEFIPVKVRTYGMTSALMLRLVLLSHTLDSKA